MARKINTKQPKKVVYLFWEGESEQAYSKYLKKEFSDRVVLYIHREKGTFATASSYYTGNNQFRSMFPEFDELWFFFDAEQESEAKWNNCMELLKRMNNAKRSSNKITIRLLMTSRCIEYWFILHYKKTAPSITTPTDKEHVLKALQSVIPQYEKGDQKSINEIAKNYKTAIENGKWSLSRLNTMGLPPEKETRDKWLYGCPYTFTTVHEAIEMIMQLPVF